MQSEMVLVRDRPSVTGSHPQKKKLAAVYAVNNTRNTNVTQTGGTQGTHEAEHVTNVTALSKRLYRI